MSHKFYVKGGINLKLLSILYAKKMSLHELVKETKLEESTIRSTLSCLIKRNEAKSFGKIRQKKYAANRTKTSVACSRCNGTKTVGRQTIVCLDCGKVASLIIEEILPAGGPN